MLIESMIIKYVFRHIFRSVFALKCLIIKTLSLGTDEKGREKEHPSCAEIKVYKWKG